MSSSRPKRTVFFSYRRNDHPDFVERIRDWFIQAYGRENVFMDFDTIPPFTRFADFIQDRVAECEVLIAIIGPRWMESLKAHMEKGDEDYVRTEIALALVHNKLIAPICIKGALPPPVQDLPSDLRSMMDYNVAFLESGTSFLDNIARLMDAVERELAESEIDTVVHLESFTDNRFDLLGTIAEFHKATDRRDWQRALHLLHRIRESKQAPRFFRLDQYEQDILEEIRKSTAQRDYAVLKMMAERARAGLEHPSHIWAGLQILWESFPSYDPDDLASEFRPQSVVAAPSDPNQLESIDELDLSIFDDLEKIDETALDKMLDPDTLMGIAHHIADNNTITYEDAEEKGILRIP